MFNKIGNQMIVCFLVATLLPLLAMGIVNHFTSSKLLYEGILLINREDITRENSRMDSFFTGIRDDLMVLHDSPALHQLIKSSKKGYLKRKKIVEKEFLSFSENKKKYCQIRYIDSKGKEIIRVDSTGEDSFVIPREKLQIKKDRYYFEETIKLGKDEIFVSKLDLNREKGQIERPYKPVIRYATPIFKDKRKREGVLILNVYADKFLKEISRLNHENQSFMLFSNDGYYFTHPVSSKEWGSQVDLDTKENVSRDFPKEIASILVGTGVSNIEFGDKIIAQGIIYPDRNNRDIYWKLIKISNSDALFRPLNRLFYIFVGILIGAFLFSLIISVLYSKTISEPIISLTNSTTDICRRIFTSPIKIYGSTEIRNLGVSIKQLKESLETEENRTTKNEDSW